MKALTLRNYIKFDPTSFNILKKKKNWPTKIFLCSSSSIWRIHFIYVSSAWWKGQGNALTNWTFLQLPFSRFIHHYVLFPVPNVFSFDFYILNQPKFWLLRKLGNKHTTLPTFHEVSLANRNNKINITRLEPAVLKG